MTDVDQITILQNTDKRPYIRIGVMVILICLGFAYFASVVIPLLVNRLPELTMSTVAGATLSPYTHDIFLEETRVNVVEGLLNANGFGGSYAINGKVQAGVTLDSPVFGIESLGSNQYQITLPEAGITFCSLTDPVQSDWSKSLLADWEKAEAFALYQAKQSLREEVMTSDVLQQTEYKVEQVLTDFVGQVDSRYQLEFVFVDMGDVRFDSTCEPFKPDSYQYDIIKNEWTRQ